MLLGATFPTEARCWYPILSLSTTHHLSPKNPIISYWFKFKLDLKVLYIVISINLIRSNSWIRIVFWRMNCRPIQHWGNGNQVDMHPEHSVRWCKLPLMSATCDFHFSFWIAAVIVIALPFIESKTKEGVKFVWWIVQMQVSDLNWYSKSNLVFSA